MEDYKIKMAHNPSVIKITFNREVHMHNQSYQLMLCIWLNDADENNTAFNYRFYINNSYGPETIAHSDINMCGYFSEKYIIPKSSDNYMCLSNRYLVNEIVMNFCKHEYFFPLETAKLMWFKNVGL